MASRSFFNRHSRLLAFLGVLLVTGGLTTLLFQEARAVSISFSTAPTSVTSTDATFVVDVTIPSGQIVPITAVDAIIESRNPNRNDKFDPVLVGSSRCAMLGFTAQGCPSQAPLTRLRGTTDLIRSITFDSAAQASTGYSLTTGYFGYGTLTGTRTGYGYDLNSPAFTASGNLRGYGYGYDTGDVATFNIGLGSGYGYADGGVRLRFSVVVISGALAPGTIHWLTVVLQTGSATIGELSSPFTEFLVGTGGGGGGGSGGGGGAVGGAATVSVAVAGSTATATITGVAGNTATIDLSGLNSVLGTLTLTLAQALTNAQVTVTTSPTPTEGAIAVPTGFNSFLYLSINVPAGAASGGSLTFTLTNAQMGANPPASVTMLHFVNGAWVSVPTAVSTTGPSGATFTATLPSFSPFAIAFDTAPPSIANLRPPDGSSATTRPLIAASLQDNRGINTAVTRMTVDGQVVTATVTATEILYTPPVALTIGTHRVEVQTTDLSGFSANRSWTFNAAAAADNVAPTVTPRSPARDGFTNNNRPAIAADYADNLGIDTTKVTATVDGAAASAPSISATGISFTPATALTDGRHTVTVTVADTSGNSGFATWSFTVDTALPLIDRVEPADGGTANSLRPTIKAVYSDPLSGIATDKVTMSVDGTAVTPTAGAGEATYTPGSDLAQGRHTVRVDVEDKAGNKASKEWTFTAVAQPQDFTLIIVLVLVLIAIVAGAGWWYMKNKKP